MKNSPITTGIQATTVQTNEDCALFQIRVASLNVRSLGKDVELEEGLTVLGKSHAVKSQIMDEKVLLLGMQEAYADLQGWIPGSRSQRGVLIQQSVYDSALWQSFAICIPATIQHC